MAGVKFYHLQDNRRIIWKSRKIGALKMRKIWRVESTPGPYPSPNCLLAFGWGKIEKPYARACLCLCLCLSQGGVSDKQWAVVGRSAHLPCNITTPSIADKVYLVLWYKGEDPQPIYSFDARQDAPARGFIGMQPRLFVPSKIGKFLVQGKKFWLNAGCRILHSLNWLTLNFKL